ncbi:precorrin-6Y C5,15-methyltransferase (decarboxylating) subunit CbiT [Methanolobus halotolerans]|uniref:Probable cobalt-precorrin-6B C(15)-methyltransferase (decarboxylating) n=1 Tax=Methanolobus halotolerans TaxID=2052935 RepID=A0A4E0R1L8_9EURY|nr:precorrin-6Y C5,15-methyltransferase (decarboxylating) subunit CbiT [Methanolobus halotolerans]TGC11079.1 precorrin-6Y C5,15-methyltransferase (decarboxylating) subunit CbiT [Methanolobus halotolerans]
MTELLRVSGGPTKPEIIAVSLSKLDLSDGSSFFDIGCGTGAVSIEANRMVRNLEIHAIDAREEAIEVARRNFESFNVDNATIHSGESSEILEKQPKGSIDCAFIGGTKNISRVLEVLAEKKVGSVVVNAVRIETVVNVINKMKELGLFDEVLHLIVSRGAPLTGETMFKPENPVYMIVGRSGAKKYNGD